MFPSDDVLVQHIQPWDDGKNSQHVRSFLNDQWIRVPKRTRHLIDACLFSEKSLQPALHHTWGLFWRNFATSKINSYAPNILPQNKPCTYILNVLCQNLCAQCLPSGSSVPVDMWSNTIDATCLLMKLVHPAKSIVCRNCHARGTPCALLWSSRVVGPVL